MSFSNSIYQYDKKTLQQRLVVKSLIPMDNYDEPHHLLNLTQMHRFIIITIGWTCQV